MHKCLHILYTAIMIYITELTAKYAHAQGNLDLRLTD